MMYADSAAAAAADSRTYKQLLDAQRLGFESCTIAAAAPAAATADAAVIRVHRHH